MVPFLAQSGTSAEDDQSLASFALVYLSQWLTGRIYPSGRCAPKSTSLDAQALLWGYLLCDDYAVLQTLIKVDANSTCHFLDIVCQSIEDSVAQVVVKALWELLVWFVDIVARLLLVASAGIKINADNLQEHEQDASVVRSLSMVIGRQDCTTRSLTRGNLAQIATALSEPNVDTAEQEDSLLSLCRTGLLEVLDDVAVEFIKERTKAAALYVYMVCCAVSNMSQ